VGADMITGSKFSSSFRQLVFDYKRDRSGKQKIRHIGIVLVSCFRFLGSSNANYKIIINGGVGEARGRVSDSLSIGVLLD